jgi:hypothetical protein
MIEPFVVDEAEMIPIIVRFVKWIVCFNERIQRDETWRQDGTQGFFFSGLQLSKSPPPRSTAEEACRAAGPRFTIAFLPNCGSRPASTSLGSGQP